MDALSESPVVRAIEALCAWAMQPEGREVMLAIHEWATVDSRLRRDESREAVNRLFPQACVNQGSFPRPFGRPPRDHSSTIRELTPC